VITDRPCRQCGARAETAFRVGDLNRRVGDTVFGYARCTACSTTWLVDVPADLAPYYPPEYNIIARSVEELAEWAISERYKIEIVKRFRTSGRLVEIGPASGGFCHLAKEAGFDVSAIEMDRRSCEFLATKLGIDVLESADEAAALEGAQPADVIAMWHVIEHLVDPWSMIKVAAERLRPGGVLVLATPNPEAFQFAVLGRRCPRGRAAPPLAAARPGPGRARDATRAHGAAPDDARSWQPWLEPIRLGAHAHESVRRQGSAPRRREGRPTAGCHHVPLGVA
jgi:2-polyprenyl-3-methyl-5-hydroxy-6-metoxy-1,4-benzoquinol methylase